MKQNPIRILFVQSSSEMYGSDRCLYELLNRIEKAKFIPVVVLPFEGLLSHKIRTLGIKVYILDPWVLRKGVFHSLRFILYLFKLPISVLCLIYIIKKEKIKIVYSNTSVIIGPALAALIARVPHIFHIREVYDSYPRLSMFYKYFLCLFSKRIIAISNSVAQLVNYACEHKVNIVYDGISIDRFRNKSSNPPEIILPWIQKGYIIVSNIGRVSRIKGQDLFIDAAYVALQHNKNMRFLIIGDVFKGNEDFMKHLKSMVNSYSMEEIVMFTGFREDIDNFIIHSDIVVVTTLITEGLGQVVMEGMAAGKVVIAPDRGGPSELIKHEIDGILYKSGDRDALAKALLKVASEPELRAFIVESAKKNAQKRFDIQKNIYNIQTILKEVVKV